VKRRAFVSSALVGGGLLCARPEWALGKAGAVSGSGDPAILLARAVPSGGMLVWRDIRDCTPRSCALPRKARVNIEALGFAAGNRSTRIDTVLDTVVGMVPFRLACNQPGSSSPCSKPFGFDIDPTAVAGFRVETTAAERNHSAEVRFGDVSLSTGRYLLLAAHGGGITQTTGIPVPAETSAAIRRADGGTAELTWLAFSVLAADA
jgi:hypothetical protein